MRKISGIRGEEDEQPARRSAGKDVRYSVWESYSDRLTKKDNGDGD